METTPLIHCDQIIAEIHVGDYTGNALDFNAYAGTVICIIGSGHTGKSDWLQTISGVVQPVSGSLSLLGKNTKEFQQQDWVRARTQLAYVQSDTTILSAANAVQNIMLPAIYHDLGSAPDIRDKAINLLEEIDVKCDLTLLPAYLRKDQCYRIAIARALILRPKALLLDNPFVPLDLTAANKFKRFLLNRVKTDNLLLMMVTHDIKFALKYSDQIVFMAENQIYQFDKTNNIQSCDIPEVRDYLNSET
jgi:ABC-type transporter Mla maintaining outer membrane lipid asymmetry ATPase subunit MlaF